MAVGDPSDGLAALTLSTHMLMMLERKGILTRAETKELVEQCLLNLETQQAASSEPQTQQAYERSREPLEQLARLLSRPR